MNSLNILSSRVIGQSSNPNRLRQRSRSQGEISPLVPPEDLSKLRSYSYDNFRSSDVLEKSQDNAPEFQAEVDYSEHTLVEKTPLIQSFQRGGPLATRSTLGLFTQRFFDAIAETIKFILSTLAAPGVFIAQCFRDDDGHYSPVAPVRKLRRSMTGSTHSSKKDVKHAGTRRRSGSTRKLRSHASRDSIASSTSESEGDRRSSQGRAGGRSRASKLKTTSLEQLSDQSTPRRSIRIKLHNEEALKRQRQRRSQSSDLGATSEAGEVGAQASLTPNSLKSPTSPSVHKVDKYPHSPVPPRPLIPPRLPSYAAASRNSRVPQKTLVLDLDETLIHSLAKGGRMSSGHMVEVKLATPMTTTLAPGAAPTTLGPQHPILYYVHKRPNCDDFLRKICKWYKLVVFTASVQEYADPVIDWLEQERKYFQARYYRQHCTFRNGAYIKDLSSVEPDLSKVMILDNSPMSYLFHEGTPSEKSPRVYSFSFPDFLYTDNAIPIEGWINDPTDNGLLNLIPMLEALQYVTDVRAFLALRRGEGEI
ncbi:Nem1-Spo7 phosphatase catalytic subunit NEM1 [Aspergillus clavatus NRRL 1]|uniref:NIF domain protein n=1 Tax=Aspergillus clavatus (strain ATCC 1007 / CBS 513.65 / DSM 816 / NCTC 3887 / NRRL 1 / QM 1276 / 107) TaxID=344612 RepID=A1CQG6_ASPCL|nr:NIF domain protein [Aspergillus clavatus NRRL 1]EAW07887.1 NIF domain protein [Aspergillus clavatus NRRL 1]